MSESTTLSSRNQQPNPETSDRNWDEGGAQKLERQLFFALLGGMLLLVAWIGRYAFGFDQQVADVAATCGAIILVIPLARERSGRSSREHPPVMHWRASR